MDFRLTEDQRALRSGTRELLTRLWPEGAARAAADLWPARPAAGAARVRELWRGLGGAGFFALRVPEAAGGVGLGMPEAVLLFEEAGRVLLPGPLVAAHLAAGPVAGAADGARVVTRVDGDLVAWLDAADEVLGEGQAGAGAAAGASRAPGTSETSGTGAGAAPSVSARLAGAVPLASVDPLTPLHRLPPPAPPPGHGSVPGPGLAPTPVTTPVPVPGYDPRGALLVAAEQLGSAGRTTATAVAYARTREQFGRPVGSFQAVKHLCAQMLVRAEIARGAVYAAAVTEDPGEIAGAKLLADEAAVRNARDCLQVHGGMGFTWEAEVHLHLKRAWVRARSRPLAAEAEEFLAAALDALPAS